MKNEKSLIRRALGDAEIEAVNGGNFASGDEVKKVEGYLDRILEKYRDANKYDGATNIFLNMCSDYGSKYTADDFLARVREELDITV